MGQKVNGTKVINIKLRNFEYECHALFARGSCRNI